MKKKKKKMVYNRLKGTYASETTVRSLPRSNPSTSERIGEGKGSLLLVKSSQVKLTKKGDRVTIH